MAHTVEEHFDGPFYRIHNTTRRGEPRMPVKLLNQLRAAYELWLEKEWQK